MSHLMKFAAENRGITPAMFAHDESLADTEFSIPLYQRLFVWEDEQVEQLLEDLWTAFRAAPSKPYYIGIVTVRTPDASDATAAGDSWELVDGQQRITVLTLLGIAFTHRNADAESWRGFLRKLRLGEEIRLQYFARPADQKDLQRLMEGTSEDGGILNANFRRFFAAFVRCRDKLRWAEQEEAFSRFVVTQTTALVSFLPHTFSVNDLNMYFERMNAAGRQLEPHEILKVRYFGTHSAMWNAAIDGGRRFEQIEPDSGAPLDEGTLEAFLRTGRGLSDDDRHEPAGEGAPPSSTRLILTAPMFLLHVLHLCIGRDRSSAIPGFWDTKNLLATFGTKQAALNADKFVETMARYRQWLDQWIIHIEDDDPQPSFSRNDRATDDENASLEELLLWQFQSMLWASSDDRQLWVLEAYEELARKEVTAHTLLRALNRRDNDQHQFEPETAAAWSYPMIDRYWFWKLDYVLWEQCIGGRLEVSDPAHREAIKAYRFRRTRSIEHLHPQNPKKQETLRWEESVLHCFGNLAMISSSFNSEQGNDTVATKFGRMKDRIGRQEIESIKLLLMFQDAKGEDANWTAETAKTHQAAMVSELAKYYARSAAT